MFSETQKENLLYRTLLALALIILAAALRIAPHPWNFTPVGAMALFSGALLKDRRLAFLFPLLALFAGDIFIGFHKLVPIVYASFLINVAIGLWLRDRRTVARIRIFPHHEFRRLAISQRLSTHRPRPRSLLLRGHPLFLEHARQRRLLRRSSLRRLCPGRTLHPCPAAHH